MKKKLQTLQLSKETLMGLESDKLSDANGGGSCWFFSCCVIFSKTLAGC